VSILACVVGFDLELMLYRFNQKYWSHKFCLAKGDYTILLPSLYVH
jgi:hypothetical protein